MPSPLCGLVSNERLSAAFRLEPTRAINRRVRSPRKPENSIAGEGPLVLYSQPSLRPLREISGRTRFPCVPNEVWGRGGLSPKIAEFVSRSSGAADCGEKKDAGNSRCRGANLRRSLARPPVGRALTMEPLACCLRRSPRCGRKGSAGEIVQMSRLPFRIVQG